MTSLRLRLFLLIVAATALVWSLAAAWTALSARDNVERVLDARLREAAVMVASLGYADGASSTNTVRPAPIPLPSYERQLSNSRRSRRAFLLHPVLHARRPKSMRHSYGPSSRSVARLRGS